VNYSPVEVVIVAITDRAVLINDGTSETWVPKSLIDEDDVDDLVQGSYQEINVQDWFLEKEGIL